MEQQCRALTPLAPNFPELLVCVICQEQPIDDKCSSTYTTKLCVTYTTRHKLFVKHDQGSTEFWNPHCQAVSNNLWLPHSIDSADTANRILLQKHLSVTGWWSCKPCFQRVLICLNLSNLYPSIVLENWVYVLYSRLIVQLHKVPLTHTYTYTVSTSIIVFCV
jgi:hypothetical protein